VYLSHQREIKDPAYLTDLTKMLDNTSGERSASEQIKRLRRKRRRAILEFTRFGSIC
jgi:predicted CopG family antitoxin